MTEIVSRDIIKNEQKNERRQLGGAGAQLAGRGGGERDGDHVHPGPDAAEEGEDYATQEGRANQRDGEEAKGEDGAGQCFPDEHCLRLNRPRLKLTVLCAIGEGRLLCLRRHGVPRRAADNRLRGQEEPAVEEEEGRGGPGEKLKQKQNGVTKIFL